MSERTRTRQKSSDLDLLLEGAYGQFSTEPKQTYLAKSFTCLYFQTSIKLSVHDPLIKHIKPVREIFEQDSLEFDEIMQRDLDDYRIATELIPYLLDSSKRDVFKLFPPIVISVLPWNQVDSKIERKYPEVTQRVISQDNINKLKGSEISDSAFPDFDYLVIKSGSHEALNEKWLASWPIGDTNESSILKINTDQTKLVIVDGQHRAMALLALYRNLYNQWEEKGDAFKKYYMALWSKERTIKFLGDAGSENISLPCILCLYPGASINGVDSETDAVSASRNIFLVLNKNARQVTQQRLTLLDDDNLISYFMREGFLSKVKAIPNLEKLDLPFRIFNVLLDESKEKTKISNEICLTSVSIINQVLENLLLSSKKDSKSVTSKQSKKLGKRTDLEAFGCHWRLGTENDPTLNSVKRSGYTKSQADKLNTKFVDIYSNNIVVIYQQFGPFNALCKATYDQYIELSSDNTKQKIRDLLFGNQGQYDILKAYESATKNRFRTSPIDPHLIEDVEWDAQKKLLEGDKIPADKALQDVKEKVIKNFLSNIKSERSNLFSEDSNVKEYIASEIRKLYSNVFKSTAFQIALSCTFYKILEDFVEKKRDLSWPLHELNEAEQSSKNKEFVDALLKSYIQSSSNFFTPNTIKRLINLFATFGDIPSETFDGKQMHYTQFKDIVLSKETSKTIDPNLWPSYKYILLEIWYSQEKTADHISELHKEFIDHLGVQAIDMRSNIFTTYLESARRLKLESERSDSLSAEEKNQVKDKARKAFEEFLVRLGVKKSDIKFNNLKNPLLADEDDEDDEDDFEDD